MNANEPTRKAAYRYIAAVLEGTAERGCGGLAPEVAAEVTRICKTLRDAGQLAITPTAPAPTDATSNGVHANGTLPLDPKGAA